MIADVTHGSGTEVLVRFEEPVQAPAPGQACVLYDRGSTRVLGGGWIENCPEQSATALPYSPGFLASGAQDRRNLAKARGS